MSLLKSEYNREEVYETIFNDLWTLLVPASGVAISMEGELIRACGRLEREYHHNGNGNAYYDGKLQDNYTYYLRLLQFNVPDVEKYIKDIEKHIINVGIDCTYTEKEKLPYKLLKHRVTHHVSKRISAIVLPLPEVQIE